MFNTNPREPLPARGYFNHTILHDDAPMPSRLIMQHFSLQSSFKPFRDTPRRTNFSHGLYLPLFSTCPTPPAKLFPFPGTAVFLSGLPLCRPPPFNLCLTPTTIPAPNGPATHTSGLRLLNTFSAVNGVSQDCVPQYALVLSVSGYVPFLTSADVSLSLAGFGRPHSPFR